jgi:asparagine synthetase B (glutamine-hydrolysing)
VLDTAPCLFSEGAGADSGVWRQAVVRRMMSDVPWGVLLSGGLDSSLVASVAQRYAKSMPNNPFPRLHSFSVGIEGSPDLKAAKEVSQQPPSVALAQVVAG